MRDKSIKKICWNSNIKKARKKKQKNSNAILSLAKIKLKLKNQIQFENENIYKKWQLIYVSFFFFIKFLNSVLGWKKKTDWQVAIKCFSNDFSAAQVERINCLGIIFYFYISWQNDGLYGLERRHFIFYSMNIYIPYLTENDFFILVVDTIHR